MEHIQVNAIKTCVDEHEPGTTVAAEIPPPLSARDTRRSGSDTHEREDT